MKLNVSSWSTGFDAVLFGIDRHKQVKLSTVKSLSLVSRGN